MTAAPIASPTPLPPAGRAILLVDDNATIVRALEFGLRRFGFAVTSASNGKDALDILSSAAKVDLLLSDVVMPGGMSGVELAREGQQRRPGLTVLLTTGYAYDVLERMGARKDEFQIVAKPYSVSKLVHRINALLA
jgi:CheY-like chemotaxis protein